MSDRWRPTGPWGDKKKVSSLFSENTNKITIKKTKPSGKSDTLNQKQRVALSQRMYERRKGLDTTTPSKTAIRQYTQMQQRTMENLRARQDIAPRNDFSPVVGISHRPGHGYDLHSLENSLGSKIQPESSPPGLSPIGQNDSKNKIRRNEEKSIEARRNLLEGYNPTKNKLPPGLLEHLSGVDGLYIPGGQDILSDVKDSRESRLEYEAAALDVARQRGIPMLAVCGGSRRLAAAYGVQEVELNEFGKGIHNKRGTAQMAHGLSFPTSHSILGGMRTKTGYMTSVDSINSTHSKVVDFEWGPVRFPDSVPLLKGVEHVNAPHHNEFLFGSTMETVETHRKPLLEVTAVAPKSKTPEGFETAFGVPHIGVTSHPEAIAGGSSKAVSSSSKQAKAWSHHVMNAFQQSVQTYQNRRMVNAQIKGEIEPVDKRDKKALSIMKGHKQ